MLFPFYLLPYCIIHQSGGLGCQWQVGILALIEHVGAGSLAV